MRFGFDHGPITISSEKHRIAEGDPARVVDATLDNLVDGLLDNEAEGVIRVGPAVRFARYEYHSHIYSQPLTHLLDGEIVARAESGCVTLTCRTRLGCNLAYAILTIFFLLVCLYFGYYSRWFSIFLLAVGCMAFAWLDDATFSVSMLRGVISSTLKKAVEELASGHWAVE